jgi:hypothetical protein
LTDGKTVIVNVSGTGRINSVRYFYPDNFAGTDILPTLPHWERERIEENAWWYAVEPSPS